MSTPPVAIIDGFLRKRSLPSYSEQDWMGEGKYPEEVHEVHRAIETLVKVIKSSSISNEDELENWVASIQAVVVSLLQITSRCRVVG